MTILLAGCGAIAASSGDEVFCRVHVLRFVLKERDCSLHLHLPESSPAPTKRTRLRPRRRAAEPQQPSDSRRKLQTIFACWREVAAENQRRGRGRDEHDGRLHRRMPVRCREWMWRRMSRGPDQTWLLTPVLRLFDLGFCAETWPWEWWSDTIFAPSSENKLPTGRAAR